MLGENAKQCASKTQNDAEDLGFGNLLVQENKGNQKDEDWL